MQNNKKAPVYFLLIMLLWITGSQEMYVNKAVLTNAVTLRYIIYFIWLLLTAILGYAAFRNESNTWAKQTWITLYAFVFVIFLLLGVTDLFILSLSKAQKTYIQTVRLFFQSPVPFVIMYLMVKSPSTKNINLQTSGIAWKNIYPTE